MCPDIADAAPLASPYFFSGQSFVTRARRRSSFVRALELLRGNNRTYPVRVQTAHGVTLLADPNDCIDRAVIEQGLYEPEVFDALHAHLRPTDVFWDIGANIGVHALTVRRVFPHVRTICFEPSPFSYCRLVWNARANHAGDVSLLNIALSDHEGYASLDVCLCGNSGTTALTSVRGRGVVPNHHMLPCRIETAANVVRSRLAPAPNVMKLDVEGHEESVLRGFGDLLFNPGLRAIVFANAAASPLLESSGFGVRELPKIHDRAAGQLNFVAVRS